ncbi:Long Chain Base Kinase [Klebsormidium nitens]|uniref:Long Chain Base Kinase n=1 Tax=Klebsormidium nitens TaxID=105231 RepID=A0A1Y1HGU9_KLENI|nr:Long Chain Base Kinase [Klebsormidium nitens]|eukprot:GAQ77654.1 Long Chain Base Kinase [Klebsormidium nitens]
MSEELAPGTGALLRVKSLGWLRMRSGRRRGELNGLDRTLSPAEIASLLGAGQFEAEVVVTSGFLFKLGDGGSSKRVKAVLVPEGLVWRQSVSRRVLLIKDTISVEVKNAASQFELHGFATNPVSNAGKRLVHVRFCAPSAQEAEKWVQGLGSLGTAITVQEAGAALVNGNEAEANVEPSEPRGQDGNGGAVEMDATPEPGATVLERGGAPILIIVNPCSGHGRGARVLEHLVLPIFRLAGLKFTVVQTERAGHAVRLASQIDLGTCEGGIVCVGGDGLVNEVLNGLFLHPDRKRAMSCPIGVVPAGSDNALVWSVLGVKTATDAALLVVKGGTTPLDAFVVRWDPTADNAAPVPQIGVCMTYYGFMSDALRRSEMPGLKRLGPLKYTAAGAWQMLSLPHYIVDVEFLEVDPEERRAWWAASSGEGSMREALEAREREREQGGRRKRSNWEERQQEALLNESADEERRQQGITWNVRARELGARWGPNEPPGKLLEPDHERAAEGRRKRHGSSGFRRRAGRNFRCVGGLDFAEFEEDGAAGPSGAPGKGRSGRPGHRHTFSAPARVGAFDEPDEDLGEVAESDGDAQKADSEAEAVHAERYERTAGDWGPRSEGGESKRVEASGSAPSEGASQPDKVDIPVRIRDGRGSASGRGTEAAAEGASGGGESGASGSSGGWVRRSGPFLSVMVCNHKCRSVQFLKTQCLAPSAEADDGHLDLMLVKPVGRVDLVRFLTLLQFSKHADLPFVEYRKVKAVRIIPGENDNRSCGIDGELLPLVGPATISVIPGLFKMMGRSVWPA